MVDKERFGCRQLLPKILTPGQTLVIHAAAGTHIDRGRRRP
ncbi:hypothetical protein LX15_002552 [Streptoalloteichus tenebrarius]|uniref:Uncharacterized protein n=1 Tax=Streptoalloteichus tenebrarius (strain ATCC 17920 / DSM 40477 / JCM 4838 / CBS 697.72 / NBRC 16177 / NCIMB 11028 / NRRL B-12390 / A12253. 1 / ISP 5477) TaxID=1933 RepID=A0ABT1HTK0_STRSD|nr:hypothetical protein [Streptoalloteichus tenebrarius]